MRYRRPSPEQLIPPTPHRNRAEPHAHRTLRHCATNDDRSTRPALYLPRKPCRHVGASALPSHRRRGTRQDRQQASWYLPTGDTKPSTRPPVAAGSAWLRTFARPDVQAPRAVRAGLARLPDATPLDLGHVTPRTATGTSTHRSVSVNPAQPSWPDQPRQHLLREMDRSLRTTAGTKR